MALLEHQRQPEQGRSPIVNSVVISIKRFFARIAHRRVIIAALVVVALVAASVMYATRSDSYMAMPSSGIVSVTGYRALSPADIPSYPTTVNLTSSQSGALRNQISAIPRLSLSESSLVCMENEIVFTISVKASQGASQPLWIAQAHLCPAPGVLYVHDSETGKSKFGRYCSILNLLISYFPQGTVRGTRAALRYC